MRTTSFITILTILTFLFSSCEKEELIKEGLVGEYAIIFISHKDTILLYNLTLNHIEFHKDGSVELPGIVTRNTYLKEDRNEKGKWKVYEKNKKFYVDISTLNQYFEGTYEVSFDINKEKEGLQLVLINDNLALGAEKFSFSTKKNQSFVDKLMKYTSSEHP